MQRTNYCAEAMDDFREKISRFSDDADFVGYMKYLSDRIDNSIKFRLPLNGHLLSIGQGGETIESIIKQYVLKYRLPFENIALEFLASNGNKYILLASENYINGEFALVADVIMKTSEKGYGGIPFGYLCNEDTSKTGLCPRNNKALDMLNSDKGLLQYQLDVLSGYFSYLIMFLAATQCNNAITSEDDYPDIKLNNSRQKKGKTPFYQYKVLTIGGNTLLGASNSGSKHNSPRMHLRRGHIRRLADKNVWVNSAVIGNKKNGILEKEYRIIS